MRSLRSRPRRDLLQFEFALAPCSVPVTLSFEIGGKWFDVTERDLLYRDVPPGSEAEPVACDEGMGGVVDCAGQCLDADDTRWIGDRECDSGPYGIFFNCPRFECDQGDCGGGDCFEEEMCFVQVSVNGFGDESYLLGDVFMRPV